MWYTLRNLSVHSDRTITAEAQVPADCVWFDGHFPKKPILPGVAQLTLVADILHRALGTPVVVEQVSRVRFKQMIQPDEVIAISLSPTNSDAAAYGFRLANSAELICSGTLKMAEPPRGDVRTHVLRSEG
jgi:3-hydroxymyristoyl/3-hydroxydecanoyl-(acyl carrier protein) dehydratase